MVNIQAQMKELFGNSCYAYCLARLFSKSNDVKTLTRYVLEGWMMDYIDSDGYVSQPLKFIKTICGHQYSVTKVNVKSLAELPDGDFIVEFKKMPTAKESHFVIANSNGVIWDPSGDSVTVKVGQPVSYRRFE